MQKSRARRAKLSDARAGRLCHRAGCSARQRARQPEPQRPSHAIPVACSARRRNLATDSTTLANGLSLSYTVDQDIGGGSGGPEAELIGETLLDARTPIMIVCHDQQEGGANAQWCFDYLGTLAAAVSPEACT